MRFAAAHIGQVDGFFRCCCGGKGTQLGRGEARLGNLANSVFTKFV